GLELELLAADDASTDGSREFLVAVARELRARGTVEMRGDPASSAIGEPSLGLVSDAQIVTADHAEDGEGEAAAVAPPRSLNPALLMASRAADFGEPIAAEVPASQAAIMAKPLSAAEVAAAAAPGARLRVLTERPPRVNRGQGACMTRCLHAAAAPLIAHMESDDERPQGAFLELVRALRREPAWHGVASRTQCIGWARPGMERYVEWQNMQSTPKAMASARFIEIPALHQTGVFRREAVLAATGGSGPSLQGAGFRDDEQWAVDQHFWLNWFHLGLLCGKVASPLYLWRQHPRQQTRLHGRLSISNLRKCKAEFLCGRGGPAHGRAVQARLALLPPSLHFPSLPPSLPRTLPPLILLNHSPLLGSSESLVVGFPPRE
ncbi:hypothetical protein CYMTET_30020, partial [Cymbomonas tetramitiformis]